MEKFILSKVHIYNSHQVLLIGIIILFLPQLILCDLRRCERQPEGHVAQKSPSDGRFRLRIEGNPEEYTPGREYTVVLQGIKSHRNTHAFIGFMIVAEKASTDPEDLLLQDTTSTGTFSLVGDNLSKFSDKCPNAVTQTSAIQKRDVRVIWKAPQAGGECVVFRATVVEHRDVWYMDDDHLVLTICKDEQDTIEKQPIIQNNCCACKEAKYELKFERVWSRHTHPKDFPSDSLSTRFSDIVGASHSVSYRFWDYGKPASPGLKQLAEHGSTGNLETELKSQSESIRTIIKARGIMQANVTEKSFAVFRVDSQNHLISLVAMIRPSPDWIVGVSGLELCMQDCTWVENKTIKLFPWDAGTDSGPSYISPDQPTDPPDVLRRITPTFPNDQNSPFYDPSGVDMKPMALLHITRKRLYERNCDDADDDSISSKACATTPWGEWNECDVGCGPGKQKRVRNYLDLVRATEANCTTKLIKKQKCNGTDSYCNVHNNDDTNQNQNRDMYESDQECELTDWGPLSPCSVSCGRGFRTSDRQYKMHGARERCQARPNKPDLLRVEECLGKVCAGEISTTRNIDTQLCRTTTWSHWSGCSVTCGIGVKTRTRKLVNSAHNRYNRRPSRDDSNYNNHRNWNRNNFVNENNDDEEEEEEDGEENEEVEVIEGEYRRHGDRRTTVGGSGPCAAVVIVQTASCGREDSICPGQQPSRCHQPPDPGSCRNISTRFVYDPSKNDCALLFYNGCAGNDNNFENFSECRKTCRLARPPVISG